MGTLFVGGVVATVILLIKRWSRRAQLRQRTS